MSRPTIQTMTNSPRQIITQLLQPTSGALVPAATSSGGLQPSPTAQRVALLERQAPQIVQEAKAAGVDIEALGIAPLFKETRLYAGVDTDWALMPVTEVDDAVVPRKERQDLQRLAAAGIDFPAMYIAHEIEKEKTKDLALIDGPVSVDRHVGTDLVGPIPEPRQSLALGEKLGQSAQQVIHTAARGARIAGMTAAGIAAAPVVLAGGLVSAVMMDPIILGAIPAGLSTVGEPAAWYVLARWDWQPEMPAATKNNLAATATLRTTLAAVRGQRAER